MTLFWIAATFVAYTYVGYPVVVWLLARRRCWPVSRPMADEDLPSVAFVLAAFNEGKRIRRKIDNLLEVRYPKDRLQIIIVSDGSTDETESEAQGQPRVKLLTQERSGKPAALNRAVRSADCEILVFCDVRQMLDVDALRHLVARLADSRVGAAGGELVMRSAGSTTAGSIGAYWAYERWIRLNESRLDSSVGLSGALYAMRRVDWEDLPEDTVLDDLLVPMRLIRRGYRVVVEPLARFFDDAQDTLEGERKRKLRTLSGNFQLFGAHSWVLSPRQNRLWWQLYSHKLFRLLVPYALAIMLVATALASGPLARTMFWLQVAGYGVAAAGLLSPRLRELRLCNIAALFLDLNLIALQALPASRSGRLNPRWEKT